MLPFLSPSGRKREYSNYSEKLRSKVIHGWLFSGLTHRQIDRSILGLDPKISKGYQSMGILHYLGLKKEFRELFGGKKIDEAIAEMKADNQDFGLIIYLLGKYFQENSAINLSDLKRVEELELSHSIKLSSDERKRIIGAAQKPEKILIQSYTYKRNPYIVAEALFRANGRCETCHSEAPFLREKDGSPYLEVHHVTPLSMGGEDCLDNVVALCPNCHRFEHSGK